MIGVPELTEVRLSQKKNKDGRSVLFDAEETPNIEEQLPQVALETNGIPAGNGQRDAIGCHQSAERVDQSLIADRIALIRLEHVLDHALVVRLACMKNTRLDEIQHFRNANILFRI
jgi:hypothetical protein